MRSLIFVFAIIVFLGCKTNESKIIEGDLYYPWLRLGNFYGQPDSLLTNYFEIKDSIGYKGMMKEDSVSANYVRLLEENNLLVTPYVYIKTTDNKSILLFLEPEHYEKLNNFTYKDLRKNKQKVRIIAKADSLIENMFVCRTLTSVNVINGETFPRESKFKIEDYR